MENPMVGIMNGIFDCLAGLADGNTRLTNKVNSLRAEFASLTIEEPAASVTETAVHEAVTEAVREA